MTDYNPEKVEQQVSEKWDDNNVKQKVRESTEGNEPFFLIDGPPYLNGAPHVGHMQGKVIKDVMLRFKQMQGYDVHDQAGFDTHGLPNELATQKKNWELKTKTKLEIVFLQPSLLKNAETGLHQLNPYGKMLWVIWQYGRISKTLI